MQKRICKKSMGLLLFVIAAMIIFPLSAKALDSCESFINENKNHLKERYGINADYDADTDLITISMDVPSAISDIKKNLKFKLVSVVEKNNDQKLSETDPALTSKYVTSNELTYNHNIVLQNIYSGFVSYEFTLVPDGYIDPIFKKACPEAISIEYKIILSMDIGGKPIYKKIKIDNPISESSESQVGSKIDCNNYETKYSDISFDYKYCDMRKKALAKKDDKKNPTKIIKFSKDKETYSKYSDESLSFKCDAFVSSDSSYYSSYYLDANTSYMIGTIDTTIGGPQYQYVYHYGGFSNDDKDNTDCRTVKENVTCNAKCEEIVSVEYGAPVASTAGLCFEYKVQVTSRVNCEADMPKPPVEPEDICTPTPRCVHSWGWVFTQAGPNEDFDRCINKCDGGKYTSKCSKKCYNQVYGKTSSKKSGSNPDIDFADVAMQVANQKHVVETDYDNKGQGTYYYSCKNNTIRWQEEDVIARWYLEKEGTFNWRSDYDCVKDKSNGGGILSLCDCSAKCYWTGCKGNVYINEEDARKDYEKNAKVYNELKSACSAYASCNTTQSTFSIDVDYTYGNDKKTTIYFPYSSNDPSHKDTIQYGENGGSKNVTCTNTDQNTTLISFDGCYRCGNMGIDENFGYNMYRTEWGFPGTWLHNKTGEISYEPVSGSTLYAHKFCIPLDANSVNTDWWKYYYARRYGNDNTYSFNDEEYIENIVDCPAGSTADGLTCHYTDVGEKYTGDITYNIRAHTREFGFFGWNIDISCFYGIYREFPNGNGCNGKCLTGDEEVAARVRSVDLNNLFPDKDNVKLESPTTTGRSPGFNWSSHATNVLKDADYQSRPSSYTKWVQTMGYDVYSDEYLDYEVKLTTNDIKNLKSASRNYTAYEGKTEVDSVVNYRSPLFRDAGILSDHSKYPNDDALKCNNMKNWESSECQDIAVGGEVD